MGLQTDGSSVSWKYVCYPQLESESNVLQKNDVIQICPKLIFEQWIIIRVVRLKLLIYFIIIFKLLLFCTSIAVYSPSS